MTPGTGRFTRIVKRFFIIPSRVPVPGNEWQSGEDGIVIQKMIV